MAIVYTGGTFDLFHSGHINFLRMCKQLAHDQGKVIVSLNTDEFVIEYKGKPPIYNYEERKTLLEACIYVDYVVPNTDGKDSKTAILEMKPDIVVIGSDWCKKDYYAQMGFTQEWLDEQKIILCYLPYTRGVSSTILKERILGE